jgi:hypothetical protein
MKKLILTLMMLLFVVISYSQYDTLYTKKQQKIPCKITEIGEYDIKYTRAGVSNGPVYLINKSTLQKYTLSDGYTELIVRDEMSIENEHADILKNRRAIKISPFSAVNNQFSFAYEKVIKVGMNLDVELGYINNSINAHPIFNNTSLNYNYSYNGFNYYPVQHQVFYSGAYVKPGVKFFLGQDYSIKGLKYAHPLKGRYVRLDLAFSYLNFQNVKRIEQSVMSYYPYALTTSTISTNVSSFAFGGFVNYGRQFILGNILTLEYYVGVGFTGQSNSYSNSKFLVSSNNSPFYRIDDGAKNISNYHGFARIPGVGLSGTLGFRIGYILPDKKVKPKEATK